MMSNTTREQLPRSKNELEELAEYYDTHDTADEMGDGEWVDPRPMATTSLRLPVEVRDVLKRQASEHRMRYSSYVRSLLERAAEGPSEHTDLTQRVEQLERTVFDED